MAIKPKDPPSIEREGNKYILPAGTTFDDNIRELTRMRDEEERKVDVLHEFSGIHPYDAIHAFYSVLKEEYGWFDVKGYRTMFGTAPVKMFPVRTGWDTTVEFPIGRICLSATDGEINVDIVGQGDCIVPYMVVHGTVKNRCAQRIKELVQKTRQYLRAHSIYTGKAIKVSFQWSRNGDNYKLDRDTPQFLNVGAFNQDVLVFNKDVTRKLELGLWTPIKRREAVLAAGETLKRGILLESRPGCGKTLTAYVTAKMVTQMGGTFIYLNSILDLVDGLKMAKDRGLVVLFVEDVDRTFAQDRTLNTDALLNAIDGIDSKDSEIIMVFTTNDLKAIKESSGGQPFLRPGRIDTVVSLNIPDEDTAVKILMTYGGVLLDPTVNWDGSKHLLTGRSPAMIAEVMKLAKLGAISRLGSVSEGTITLEDIEGAVGLLDDYQKLIQDEVKGTPAPMSINLHLPPGLTAAVKNGQPTGGRANYTVVGERE